MYSWKMEIILNSGKELTVYYRGYENNSDEVARKMLTGNPNNMNGFNNDDGTKNVFVRIGEIASVSISRT